MVVSKRKIVLDGFVLTESLHNTVENNKVFGVTNKISAITACSSNDGCDKCTGCVSARFEKCSEDQGCFRLFYSSCNSCDESTYSSNSCGPIYDSCGVHYNTNDCNIVVNSNPVCGGCYNGSIDNGGHCIMFDSSQGKKCIPDYGDECHGVYKACMSTYESGCFQGLNIKASGSSQQINNGVHLGHDNITWLVEGDILCDGCNQCTGCNGCVGCYDCHSSVGCSDGCQGCTGECQGYVQCLEGYSCCHSKTYNCTADCQTQCQGCNGYSVPGCDFSPKGKAVSPKITQITCPCYAAYGAGCGNMHNYSDTDQPTIEITITINTGEKDSDGNPIMESVTVEIPQEKSVEGGGTARFDAKDIIDNLPDKYKGKITEDTIFINEKANGEQEEVPCGSCTTACTGCTSSYSPCEYTGQAGTGGNTNCGMCTGASTGCSSITCMAVT